MPAIRKIIFISALCLGLLPLRAQLFSVYGGPQFQNIKSKTFEQFRSSYNTEFVDDLKVDGLSPRLGRGMLLGLSFGVLSGAVEDNPSSFALEYSRSSQVQRAKFTDGAVRDLKMKNNVFSFNVGLNFPIALHDGDEFTHFLYIKPEVGIGMGSSKILSSFTTGSSGKMDLDISGEYKTISGNVMTGLSITYLAHYVGVKFYARYNAQMFAGPLLNKERETGEDRLYRDVKMYNSGFIGDEVRNDFRYMQYGISLVFGISEED